MKKIVVAIDSFKGSLSTQAAGNAVKEGVLAVYPDAHVTNNKQQYKGIYFLIKLVFFTEKYSKLTATATTAPSVIKTQP